MPGIRLDTVNTVVNKRDKASTIMVLQSNYTGDLLRDLSVDSNQGFPFTAMLASVVKKRIFSLVR